MFMKHRLREIRTRLKMTQTEMADVLGLSLRGYQYIEKGERDLMPKHVRTASKTFGIPEEDFFETAQKNPAVKSGALGFANQLQEGFNSAPPNIQKAILDLLKIKGKK